MVFDNTLLARDPTSGWLTPGHPSFEVVREEVIGRVRDDLQRGSVFFDLHRDKPYRLDVFTASIKDGRGNHIHRRLFAVEVDMNGPMSARQPTIFLDLGLAPDSTQIPEGDGLPDRQATEQILIDKALNPFLADVSTERERETETISRHIEISLNELIHRQNLKMAGLLEQQQQDDKWPLLAANIKKVEDRIDELNGRLERRREELQKERQCMIGDIQYLGGAWVLPHPERSSPDISPMVKDDKIERIAVDTVISYEKENGRQAESVEDQNRGFDLISRKPHPEDPKTATEIRFIEVKGGSAVGELALTTNEYKTAERLKKDYWLYVVFNCASTPEIHLIRDPVRLGWEPLVKIDHYHVGAQKIIHSEKGVGYVEF